MSPLRAKAEQAGSADFSPHFCGQAAALSGPGTTAHVTQRLVADTLQRLDALTPPPL